MILTGRGVGAEEALAMGLANRVVPKGKALEEATKLAESLLRFPQACMNIDRANCFYSAYDAKSFEDALRNEYEIGRTVISVESVEGAAKFSRGSGRHGSFSL
jgi:enoyl-CoA hydratase/carnithine racemase